MNHFENFKLLIDWLGLPSSKGKTQFFSVPPILRTYEIQEIAKLLKTDQYQVWVEAVRLASKKEGI